MVFPTFSPSPSRLKNQMRRTLVVATISIGLILFVLGLFVWLLLSGNHFLSESVGTLPFQISLQDNLPEAERLRFEKILQEHPATLKANYVSKEAVLADYIAKTGDKEIVKIMGGINPLLAAYHLQIHPNYLQLDSIQKLKQSLSKELSVASIDYPIEMRMALEGNTHKFRWMTILLAIITLLIGSFLIINTMKAAMHAERLSIRTMQLIGATPAFVRKPFLKMGILQGFAGGIIAVTLLVALILGFSWQLGITNLVGNQEFFAILAAILLFGTCLGAIGSYWAVGKYLNRSIEQLYGE